MRRIRRVTLLVAAIYAGFSASAAAQPLAPGEEPSPAFEWVQPFDADPAIPSPEAFLGQRIGTAFTRSHDILAYSRALAEASDRVTLTEYGRSHQGRPLYILTITAPRHHADLERILERNRALTTGEPADRATLERNPTIAWFSFGVHGNEPSVCETAIATAYTLAASRHPRIEAILENTVVVIDPNLNPDGRQRYVSWFENEIGTEPDANPDSSEHWEPWPGGRTNHYMFDLNRDWIWLTQPESRSRLPIYRTYMPHLHVDNHEQGYRSPYFFGAGDDPYNTNIPQSTKDWIEKIGAANAEAFDREGYVFATAERFDYLYPGYGKVLPVHHGAIGLLTEAGGHSRGGLSIEYNDREPLTLLRRTRWHYVTTMSALEFVASERRGMVERFHSYFASALTEARENPAAFVIPPDTDPALLAVVHDLCTAHGVRIDRLTRDVTLDAAAAVRGAEAESRTFVEGAWVIDVAQPMGRLARIFFEPDPELTELETYDITSWALPGALGIEAWVVERFGARDTEPLGDWSAPVGSVTGEGAVALLVDSGQHRFPVAIGIAERHELFARRAGEAITIGERTFETGSLIVHTLRNRHADLDAFANDLAAAGLHAHRVGTGLASEGPSLGNNANRRHGTARVAIVRGRPTSSNSFGEHWHLVDVIAGLPHSTIDADRFASAELSRFGTVLLPSAGAFDDDISEKLEAFARGGGVIVASNASARWVSRELLSLAPVSREDDERPDASELTFAERRDRADQDRVPGQAVRLVLDTTHPLAGGLPSELTVVKRNSTPLPIGASGYAVARYAESPIVGGWMSERNIAHIAGKPAVTAHRLGRGWVIAFADDATMRGFQHGAMRFLLNAVTYGDGR